MKRSKFDLSHRHHTTMEMGKLVPFFLRDCLPGDIHRISAQAIFRAIPMIAPMMSKVEFYTQFYFVPYRLLWDNWTQFITGGDDGLAAPQFPIVTAPADKGFAVNSFADYCGFPINQPEIEVSAMPFRAMCKIWNDHYKIDDIEADIEFSTADGNDTSTSTDLLNCHWARDTFTRAKPFTQRGAQVAVPIQPSLVDSYAYPITLKSATQEGESQKTLPLNANLILSMVPTGNNTTGIYDGAYTYDVKNPISTTQDNYIEISIDMGAGAIGKGYIKVNVTQGDILGYSNDPYQKIVSINFNGKLVEDSYFKITNFTGSFESTAQNKISTGKIGSLNIRDLRIASALQRFQEKSLKYGAEYEDYCRQEFGVTPRDSRLNKSEYIGGSKGVLQISEIMQTSASVENSPLGNMAGAGIGSMRQKRIKYFCPEHGIIIGFASIRPETIYTQGIKRDWLKRTRFDFFTREFANIGAQEIFQQELYATKDNKGNVFGYNLNGNYNEYRHDESHVSGNFRTDLSFWHLGRIFSEAPVLNSSFMKMQPRKDIFAVTDQTLPPFLVMFQCNNIAYRPIPKRAKNILK